MKKIYAMIAIAAFGMPAIAETINEDAVSLTTRIGAAEASTRPTDANWLVATYVEGGFKYTKVETVEGVKKFVQHGDFVTYSEAEKKDTDQGTTNKKLNAIFTGKLCNGIKFGNIAMNSAIGEVTVPDAIYVDGEMTEKGAKNGSVVFRYGFGTDLRAGLKTTGIDVSKMSAIEVGLEVPNNNRVEVTLTSSLQDIKDGLGNIGHVVYFEMLKSDYTSSDTRKSLYKSTGELQGDKDYLSYIAEGKEETWYHLPVKWLDIIVHDVKPGDTVGIYSIKSSENDGAGVNSIISDDDNAPIEYYNIQGVRVANPGKGLCIKRQGSKVTKMLVK